jgi:hypothetical protein
MKKRKNSGESIDSPSSVRFLRPGKAASPREPDNQRHCDLSPGRIAKDDTLSVHIPSYSHAVRLIRTGLPKIPLVHLLGPNDLRSLSFTVVPLLRSFVQAIRRLPMREG